VALDANSQVAGLDSCTLLDQVTRESLRLAPPVHGTIRVATKNDRIPLSQPILKQNGKYEDYIAITKGSFIHIPIEAHNTCADIWGPDAHEFNPSRWDKNAQSTRTHPGLIGLMTFSFGPQSCPGYYFALLEIKIFVAILVSRFNFQPEGKRISRFPSIVTRPNDQVPLKRIPTLPVQISRR